MHTRMEVQQRPLLALGVRLMAACALSTMLLMVKLVGERGVSLVETVFWRQLFPTIGIGLWLLSRGELHRLRTPRFARHTLRAFLGLIGMFLNLGVVLLLPLAESTILGFTSPIFAVMLAALLLREKVGPVRWLAVAMGLIGVIVIAGPGTSAMPLDGLTVGISAAFMVALLSILVRDLTRTEDPIVIVFWFSALTTPVVAIPALWMGHSHDLTTWGLLLGIGLVGAIGQLLLTTSLRLGSVSSVIVMDYSAFGWAMMWGMLFFAHIPPTTTWLGLPMIVGASLIIVWREHRLHVARQVAAVGE